MTQYFCYHGMCKTHMYKKWKYRKTYFFHRICIVSEKLWVKRAPGIYTRTVKEAVMSVSAGMH